MFTALGYITANVVANPTACQKFFKKILFPPYPNPSSGNNKVNKTSDHVFKNHLVMKTTGYCPTSFRFFPQLILLLLFSMSLTPALSAQKGVQAVDPSVYERLLCVKFQNDLPVYAENGRLTDRGARILTPLGSLLDAGVYTKMIQLEDAVLDEMRHNAEVFWAEEARKDLELEPGVMADLNRYFVLCLNDGVNKDEIVRRFKTSPLIEYVSMMPKPVAPPTPGNYTSQQTYVSSNYGIGADQVYSAYNNRGAGVRVVDIEGAFNTSHADLPYIQKVSGTYFYNDFGDDHGTAVLGEMVSKNNGWGTTGVASSSTALFAGIVDAYGYPNLPNAITRAANAIQPGDVILIEQHLTGPYSYNGGGQYGFVPVEYYKANYDAVKIAVGNKRIVVEAAGNGHQNLDDPANFRGYESHYPFTSANNSGAIMVGAGCAAPGGSSTARSRLDFSNYGSRLDVQAYGEKVWTTAYGDAYNSEGKNYWFTTQFSGTSSASPIVAGACLLIQSAYKSKNNGNILSPLQMRSLLISTGKAQQSGKYPSSQKIGPLPNASAAIQSFMSGSAACNAPSTAQISASNITSSTVRLSCSVSGVQAYDWIYRKVGASSWTELPGGTSNYSNVTGLASNTQYEFRVAVRCDASTWSDWSAGKTFTTTGASLSNDNPCGAISLNAYSSCSTTNGTNVGATATFSGSTCGETSPRDVWFKCAIPGSGFVTFRTYAGTLDDAMMAVYWGDCSNLNYIVCEDDNSSGNTMPVIAITGQPGTMLYIRIWGYGNATGSFRICALNYNSSNITGGDAPDSDLIVYHIEQNAGTSPLTPADERTAEPSSTAASAGNVYPNPAAEIAVLPYTLSTGGTVRITLCDALGRTVQVREMEQDAGEYREEFHLQELNPGAYYVRFESGELVRVQQLRVMR